MICAANKSRLNLRLGMIALIMASIPVLAFADCGETASQSLDYIISAAPDGNVAPIALRPEDQPQGCIDQSVDNLQQAAS